MRDDHPFCARYQEADRIVDTVENPGLVHAMSVDNSSALIVVAEKRCYYPPWLTYGINTYNRTTKHLLDTGHCRAIAYPAVRPRYL